jgi:hypothetical protein
MHQASATFQEHQGLLLTNVDDVTQDQPNPRALRTSVRTALAGSAPRFLPQHRSQFHRNDSHAAACAAA